MSFCTAQIHTLTKFQFSMCYTGFLKNTFHCPFRPAMWKSNIIIPDLSVSVERSTYSLARTAIVSGKTVYNFFKKKQQQTILPRRSSEWEWEDCLLLCLLTPLLSQMQVHNSSWEGNDRKECYVKHPSSHVPCCQLAIVV